MSVGGLVMTTISGLTEEKEGTAWFGESGSAKYRVAVNWRESDTGTSVACSLCSD